MNTQNQTLPKQVIGNAISAYGLIFICVLFLFKKNDENINHPFVKSHVVSALSIHLLFLFSYFIFVNQGLGATMDIFGWQINHIITQFVFGFLLFTILIGIIRAKSGKTFSFFGNIVGIKRKKLIDINRDSQIDEKDKLTLLISYIPFLGFYNSARYYHSQRIQSALLVNTTISGILYLLFVFHHKSLFEILLLLYIIFITFIGINIFSRHESLEISVPKILKAENQIIFIESFGKYIKGYFSKDNFEKFSDILEKTKKHYFETEELGNKKLETLETNQRIKNIIYIPILSLFLLLCKKNKYSVHIYNSAGISILFLIITLLVFMGVISQKWFLLVLFPLLFGIGFQNHRFAYKIPYIYHLFILIKKIYDFFKKVCTLLKKNHKKEVQVIGKVGKNNESSQ